MSEEKGVEQAAAIQEKRHSLLPKKPGDERLVKSVTPERSSRGIKFLMSVGVMKREESNGGGQKSGQKEGQRNTIACLVS